VCGAPLPGYRRTPPAKKRDPRPDPPGSTPPRRTMLIALATEHRLMPKRTNDHHRAPPIRAPVVPLPGAGSSGSAQGSWTVLSRRQRRSPGGADLQNSARDPTQRPHVRSALARMSRNSASVPRRTRHENRMSRARISTKWRRKSGDLLQPAKYPAAAPSAPRSKSQGAMAPCPSALPFPSTPGRGATGARMVPEPSRTGVNGPRGWPLTCGSDHREHCSDRR
jgi:hypothetical protein